MSGDLGTWITYLAVGVMWKVDVFFFSECQGLIFYENIIFTRFFWLLGNFFGNIFAKLQPKQFLRIFFEEIQVANRKVCWKRDEFVE